MLSIIKNMIKSDFSLNEIAETVRMFIGKRKDEKIDFYDFYFSERKYNVDLHHVKMFLIELKVIEGLVFAYCPKCENKVMLKNENKIITKPLRCKTCNEDTLVPLVGGSDYIIMREIKNYSKEEKWN